MTSNNLEQGQAVLVTTAHRGVFFGYFNGWCNDAHEHISLKKARNCLYWSKDTRGFLGLAADGPTDNCRVGPAVDIPELRDVTCVAAATDDAAKRWEAAPW